MQAIILAGGFGTRLQSAIGADLPKPMAPVGGEPFLAHYIRYLRGQGVHQIVLSVHHRKEAIHDYFSNRFEGVTIKYAEESEPLGTGGALRFALEQLQSDEPILVTNGDSFVEVDIQSMVSAHSRAGTTLTIGLRKMPGCSRYGEVLFDEKHRITDFRYPGSEGEGWISTGVYVVNPNIFSAYNLPAAFSFENDFQRIYAAQIKPLAWLTDGYFIDIGIPEDYARAQVELKQRVLLQEPQAA